METKRQDVMLTLDNQLRLRAVDFLGSSGSAHAPQGHRLTRLNAGPLVVHVATPHGFKLPRARAIKVKYLGKHGGMLLFENGIGGYVWGERVDVYPGYALKTGKGA